MDAGTTLTLSGIISLAISAGVSYLVHKALVTDVHEVLKDIEQSRLDNVNRQKAQVVAELLAYWIRTPGFVENETQDAKTRLNELSFQCALWLPPDILEDLSKKLTNSNGAKDVKQILADVRTHLGNEPIDPKIIVNW